MSGQRLPQAHYFLVLLAALCTTAFVPASRACDCLWEGSFTEVAPSAELLVVGTVATKRGNAMDIDVDLTLAGPDWIESPRVWLKTGNYCRPDPTLFAEGDRLILALKRLKALPNDGFNPSTPNVSFGRLGDYELSNCGGYWLTVEGLRASGNLVPGMPRFSHDPKMSPVLIGHIIAFLKGTASLKSLIDASMEDPELEELKKSSRGFLRGLPPVTLDPETILKPD